MTAKIIPIGCVTKLDLPADQVLEQATGRGLTGVVILGWNDDGSEYFASSIADGGTVLWLMEKLKKKLMEVEA